MGTRKQDSGTKEEAHGYGKKRVMAMEGSLRLSKLPAKGFMTIRGTKKQVFRPWHIMGKNDMVRPRLRTLGFCGTFCVSPPMSLPNEPWTTGSFDRTTCGYIASASAATAHCQWPIQLISYLRLPDDGQTYFSCNEDGMCLLFLCLCLWEAW